MASQTWGKRRQFIVKADVQRASDDLVRDSSKHADLLVDQALFDLLKKYHWPLTIKDALRTTCRLMTRCQNARAQKREPQP